MTDNHTDNLIPGFMQESGGKGPQTKASTLNHFGQVRQASLDSKPRPAKVQSQSADRNLIMVIRNHWKAFAVSMTLGAALFAAVKAGGDATTNRLHENDMLHSNSTYTETVRAIKENMQSLPMTKDAVGKTSWWLDTITAANDVNTILEQGADPLIVLGALADTLDEPFEQDELRAIVTESFGEDPNSLVQNFNPERYAEGIQDPDFKKDIREYIVQQTEAEMARTTIDSNDQLEAMFKSETVSTDSDVKGMGGK